MRTKVFLQSLKLCKLTKVLLYCFCVIFLWQNHFVHAMQPLESRGYRIVTANNTYEFVMNAAGDKNYNRKSGLYRLDKPDQALWTVPWYAHRVTVSSDGKHLVRHGLSIHGSLKQEGLSFFKNGRLVRTYSIKDLLSTPEGLVSIYPYFSWIKEEIFDDIKGLLYISTVTGDAHVFDIAKGEIISSKVSEERENSSEKIIDFDVDSKTIELKQPQAIKGLILPQGTKVKVIMRGGRIESAQLGRQTSFGRLTLQSGSKLGLISQKFFIESLVRKEYWQEPKDEFADMQVTSIEQPTPWQIGPVLIRGKVMLEKKAENLIVYCSENTICIHAGGKVSEILFDAQFNPLYVKKILP